jgi:hypothetical protein
MLKPVHKRRHWQLALLFALVLFAQQQAFAHQISHFSHDSTQQDSKRDNSSCAKCPALAHLGDSPPPALTSLDIGSPELLSGAAPRLLFPPRLFTAYRSRAPPILR